MVIDSFYELVLEVYNLSKNNEHEKIRVIYEGLGEVDQMNLVTLLFNWEIKLCY